MNKQQLRHHLKTVRYTGAGEVKEGWLDETMQLIDQYAYEYAERVIGVPLTYESMNLDEIEGSYDDAFEQGSEKTITDQRQRNKRLSSHKKPKEENSMDLAEYLQKSVKAQRLQKLRETNQMTLGELIQRLESIPLTWGTDNSSKHVVYDFEFLIPTTLDSWRGSYDELALGWTYSGYAPDDCPDHNGVRENTLENLLKELRDAVGKTFTGWKGGDFVMSENTPIWIANPGNSGNTGITEVVDNGYTVILMTGFYEY